MAKNSIIIACAGSGKTSRLVRDALANRDRRIALVTYTNNNAREIHERFRNLNSGTPSHVEVMTWFGFLLRECARPYQRSKYAARRIESLLFVNHQSARGAPEADTARHYFAHDGLIYSDKIAKFVVECEARSSNAVSSRLGEIYTDLFIDEFQDLAGWDLDVIKMLLKSRLRVTLVGDPRQHIYRTNPSRKNKQYLGAKLVNLVKQWEKKGLCLLDHMSGTHRCDEGICNFSNDLWSGGDGMRPLRSDLSGHDGVFLVSEGVVEDYIKRFRPQLLRHDKRVKSFGLPAVNFGLAKGLEFDRVLIVPTAPIRTYLRTGVVDHVQKARERLHVAVTRAKYSVAFIFDADSPVVRNRWVP